MNVVLRERGITKESNNTSEYSLESGPALPVQWISSRNMFLCLLSAGSNFAGLSLVVTNYFVNIDCNVKLSGDKFIQNYA